MSKIRCLLLEQDLQKGRIKPNDRIVCLEDVDELLTSFSWLSSGAEAMMTVDEQDVRRSSASCAPKADPS